MSPFAALVSLTKFYPEAVCITADQMQLKTKKLLTNISTGVFFLLGGIEYAVIIPTLYLYVKDLNGNESFYGLTFAAFCISGLFSSLIFGRITDHLRKTKLCILIANMFEIGGNFMYFVGNSKYMVLGGRLVAGVGMGAGASIFAQLAWTSTEKERTAVFSVALAMRQLGILIGPALNIFLEKINFKLGPFKVSENTVPGLFMVALWCLMQIMIIFMYYDLPSIHENNFIHEDSDVQSRNRVDHMIINKSDGEIANHYPNSIHPGCSINSESGVESTASDDDIPNIHKTTSNRAPINWINEYLREEIVVLLGFQFILFFNQCALESLIVPLTTELFGWDPIENSIFFCGASLIAMSVFLLIRFLSKRVSDRWIIALGLTLDTTALVYLLVFIPNMQPNRDVERNEIILLIGCVMVILGLPCFVVGSTSLLSKLTSMRTQGTTQGVRRVVTNLGIIMGPLWAGALLKRMYIMLGVMVGLQGMMVVMTVLSFRKLKVREKESGLSSEQTDDEEKEPLLVETA